MKRCPHCKVTKSLTEFYHQTRRGKRTPGSWCKVCMTQQVVDRQRRYKAEAVEMKGGCCSACGFNSYIGALEFHHLDPSKKDASINRLNRSPTNEKVQAELAKCVLLCANCHRMVHAGIIPCPPLS